MDAYKKVSTPAQRIREAMDLRNMKQVDLAEKTGISKPNISCYLSGKYEPKQIALYNLGRVLDVAEMWLAGFDIPMERPAEQKENDELADLMERIKKDQDFRELVFEMNHLNPGQIDAVRNLLSAFPQE